MGGFGNVGSGGAFVFKTLVLLRPRDAVSARFVGSVGRLCLMDCSVFKWMLIICESWVMGDGYLVEVFIER